MTQEVQPLTWQKRTNIEEHQQFFAKINEIVGQLSATVERSETGLEEANTALTNARTAVATANAASAQAVEAATTVAGFNTRLTAVEVQAATNKSDISQLDVETQDLYDRDAQSVKLSADHIQVITGGLDLRGTNRSSNTSVGADDTVIANGHRIVQELTAYGATVDAKLNSYASMVRTSGNQNVDGLKTFKRAVIIDRSEPPLSETPTTQIAHDLITAVTQGDNYSPFVSLHSYREASGSNELSIDIMPTNWDGSFSKRVRLRVTVDGEGVGHLLFYNGSRTITLA